jgi:hypothetical protein
MEEAEDIESFYDKEIEKADKEFLKNPKDQKDAKEKEIKYNEALKKIQAQYKKKYEKYFQWQKENLQKNKKKGKNKERKKTRIENRDYRLQKTGTKRKQEA